MRTCKYTFPYQNKAQDNVVLNSLQKTFAGASKKPNRAGGIRNISQELQISQLRKKQVETANEVIGRLATEATQEIERLKASKGFTDPVTKKLVWQVITLFRDVLRDESEKRGKVQASSTESRSGISLYTQCRSIRI